MDSALDTIVLSVMLKVLSFFIKGRNYKYYFMSFIAFMEIHGWVKLLLSKVACIRISMHDYEATFNL